MAASIAVLIAHTSMVSRRCAIGRREMTVMPEKRTKSRARRAKMQGKAPSTQAGEFVREEVHHVRSGKHGARSAKQAVAIGLSKARRSGVEVPPPRRGTTSEDTREKAERDNMSGRRGRHRTSPRRARTSRRALERESTSTTSRGAMSKMARGAARRRSPSSRHESAVKAARTRARRRSGGTRSGARRASRSGTSARGSR